MTAKIHSATFLGLDGKLIDVEVDVLPGLHSFSIVGLPDSAVKEAKERVSLAIKNSGANPPLKFNKKIVVNLAPADIKKEGPGFDLPIAIAFLLATGQIKQPKKTTLLLGELGLDGVLRRTSGVLPAALLSKACGFEEIIIPFENGREASVVDGIHAIGAKTLKDVILHMENIAVIEPLKSTLDLRASQPEHVFGYIQGQEHAKRCLEIIAAGSHNLFMHGPPGAGKTLLAHAALELMPPMSMGEILEVSKIYSICGLLSRDNYLVLQRPFRAPHHASSEAAIIGGGQGLMPGEITKAHRGILFLDEFPEFHRDVIESLRQPLETGLITISRARGSVEFPARFVLIAAMNPCPCGFFGDPKRECRCSAHEIRNYHKKVSGPILDRMDLQIQILRPPTKKLFEGERSRVNEIKGRIDAARTMQLKRFEVIKDEKKKVYSNAEMEVEHLKEFCALDPETERFAKTSIENLSLSPRSFHRLLRVSRTIADLSGEEKIRLPHFAEALQYREIRLEA